jgi:hypothetical protein
LCLVKFLASNTNNSNNEINSRETLESCNLIDGLSIANTTEQVGVTEFVQEACDQVDVLGKHYVHTKLTTSQPDIQNLTQYFSRPRAVATGAIAAGTMTRVYGVNVDSTTLPTFFPDFYQRLRGVYGIRFSIVFTVQVNATPFHQGVLAANWQYQYNTANTFSWPRSSVSGACTNLPHVRLDMASSTMAVLKVPFLNILEFMPVGDKDLSTGTNAWAYGYFALNTILPSRYGAGLSDATYRVMMHLEDLELIGAAPHEQVDVTLQAGKRLNPINEEFENDAYPYSSTLHSASRTVSWVAKGVPSLSSIAGPTSWFLGKAAGVLRYLGYSKPQIQEPIVRMHPTDTIGEFNVDVPSATVTIGPFASNHLSVDPQFAATDVDEMSFSYILSQWSQIRIGQLSTTTPLGTNIYVCPCTPQVMWFRSNFTGGAPYCNIPPPKLSVAGNTFNSFLPSHIYNLAQMFGQWRGGFEFRFTFAKTKMHSGRVICSFTPELPQNFLSLYSSTQPTVTVAAATASGPQPFSHSAVFDLRDGNVFTFEVPFMSVFPYLALDTCFGSINMAIYDPLQASTTVSSTVDFMVEVRAKPDFELAFPLGPRYPAHNRGTVLQGGKILDAVNSAASQACVGEQICSVKQLIMMPKTTIFGVTGVSSRPLMPWYYQPPISPLTPGPTAYPSEAFGFGGNLASCYVYARGGSDYHAVDSTIDSIIHGFNHGTRYGDQALPSTTDPVNVTAVNMPRMITSNSGVHARFPAYQRTARVLTGFFNAVAWTLDTLVMNITPSGFGQMYFPRYFCRVTTGRQIVFSRCAADDAMLGHYIGPAPLCLRLGAANSVWDPDSTDTVFQAGKNISGLSQPISMALALQPMLLEDVPTDTTITPSPPPTLVRTRSLRRESGDRGVTPGEFAGKLTNFLHTLPATTTSILDTVAAVTEPNKDQ